MIKPKELRKDNIVWFRPYSEEAGHGQKNYVFVEEVLRDGINLTEEKQTEHSALDLYGIHIMPEILDQFHGFNKVEKEDGLHYSYEDGPLTITFIRGQNNWLRKILKLKK